MAGLDDQVTYCPALVVHYKVIDVADRSRRWFESDSR